ncbi:MAG: hypothetical protein AAFR13_06235 [Pseudomonadota bacterium]
MVNARKRFRGTITDVTAEAITLFRDQPAMGEDNDHTIPFNAIADARLILTDDLIRASLKADKAARAARGDAEPENDNEFDTDVPDETD